MIKIIAFLYNRHKNDERVSDIAHLQTFADLALTFMVPILLLLKLIDFDAIIIIRNISKLKVIEYAIGIIVVFFLYFIFCILFPKKFLDIKYKEFTYGRNYLLHLRIISISLSVISLAFLLISEA